MENIATTTPFSMIYDSFLSKITDDMYMELTELDTFRLLEELLDAAMHKFEFPRFDITDFEGNYVDDVETYEGVESNNEEVPAIIYDFKFTSQANHMSKLLTLKKDYEREGFHLQRLYKRRLKDEDGIMRSTFGTIMEESPVGRRGSGLWS